MNNIISFNGKLCGLCAHYVKKPNDPGRCKKFIKLLDNKIIFIESKEGRATSIYCGTNGILYEHKYYNKKENN